MFQAGVSIRTCRLKVAMYTLIVESFSFFKYLEFIRKVVSMYWLKQEG